MSEFRYLAEYSRVYVDRALVVNPGDVVEWDEAPDDSQWVPVDPPSDDADGQGDQAEPPTDEPESPAQAPDAANAADSSASKKTTRRAAPAQTPEE